MKTSKPFSQQLEQWLKSPTPKTLTNLTEAFAEKSFAICFLLLMFIPALPLPTGGITHVFEIITMLLALELTIGRHTVWLPRRWRHKPLGAATQKKAIPFMIRRIRWFERFARRRLSGLLEDPWVVRFVGLIVFVLALAAFLAPPFSGIDTLPSLGIVAIALSLILEDAVIFIIGLLIGAAGVGVEVGLSTLIVHFLHINL